MLQLGEQSSNLMKTVTGIYDASLGAPSNEQTGRAIIARQQQGDIATFNYQDNMAKGIQRTWEIFIDLIPKIYDTERSIRILGADGSDDYMTVNQVVPNPQTGELMTVHDLNQGRYDVTITTGPNFSTKRQEATEMYGQLIQQFPQIMGVAGDLVAKSWDLPYSEQIAERLKTLLPPQIQESMNKDHPMPPEVQQAMAQVNQAAQQVQQHGQLVQAASQELEQKKFENDKQQAEIRSAISDLKTQQARFDADVAKQMAAIAVAQANLQKADTAGDREALQQQVAEAVQEINKFAVQTIADIQQRTTPQVIVPPKPRIVAVHTARKEGGGMVSVPQYEDQQAQQPMPMTNGGMQGSMGQGMPQ
jgi:hypothetical protein